MIIELAILKNFDSGTYKAGAQLAGSLTTYFDDVPVSRAIPTSAMVVGNRVILAIPGDNPKDACVIATWPGGSAGGAEVHGNEYHDPDFEVQGVAAGLVGIHAALATNVHGISGHPLYSTQNKTYYIDESTGNDNNNGESPAAAFKTWAKAETMIPTFVGHYYNIRIIGNLTGSITLGARIIGGYVRISGDTTTPSNQVVSGGVALRGLYGSPLVQYLQIKGQIEVTGCLASPFYISGWVRNLDHCEIFGTAAGATSIQSSIISFGNCDFGSSIHAECIYAISSQVYSYYNTGNGTSYGLSSYGSIISKYGTQPTGSIANEYAIYGGIITPLRDQQRINSGAGSAISPDLSVSDMYIRTGLYGTLAINNPIGTPLQGEHLIIRLKDDGTPRAITWGTQYRGLAVALPGTTVSGKLLYMEFRFNSTDTKWDMTVLTQEA
jgi:hypothetical protein